MKALANCDDCMMSTTTEVRQAMGCGYAPPPGAWLPVSPHVPRGYKHETPTVCPGYSTKLPEVNEAARARLHWSKGALGVVLGGEPPTDALLLCVEVLESASNECEYLRMLPAKDGGLRE